MVLVLVFKKGEKTHSRVLRRRKKCLELSLVEERSLLRGFSAPCRERDERDVEKDETSFQRDKSLKGLRELT